MRLFIKVSVFVLVLILATPFFLKGSDNRPLVTLDDIKPGGDGVVYTVKRLFRDATSSVRGLSVTGTDKQTVVYRWRNERGYWHYSDRPRTVGASQKIIIDPNANQLDSAALDALLQAEPSKDSDTTSTHSPLTISPNQLGELMKGARGVQEQADQRNQALESL